MGHILAFPAVARREARGALSTVNAGELVAMRHIDLDTVVETIRFLRDVGRDHLLDGFNRAPGLVSAAAAPVDCGNR